jgi:hypothetical protein
MKKLLKFFDAYALKILIAFLLIFTVLYPKLPSIHIINTWVYIRLEDFIILSASLIWIVQLLRRKVTIPKIFGFSIGTYWLIGLISLIYSIIFIGPTLSNYFPHIALLNYLRRIEYMILFFIAFSTIKSPKDIRDYFIIISITLTGAIIYGLGQRYYLFLWEKFPDFFKNLPFCFPSFQTGNEEFAKGMPLCLPYGARITSTFGGHYDLAAYLVLVIPIVLGIFLSVKKITYKILSIILFIAAVILLIFTASRISFIAYLVASVVTLTLYRKKLLIIPLLILSMILLIAFSESTAKRFLSTITISSIVTNNQGQLIGEALPQDLKKKISETGDTFQPPPPAQNLPVGSGFIGLPEKTTPIATSVAVVEKTLSNEETKKLKLAAGSTQISTISGSFLVKKALVYDISFTTRFQAEWPNAWNAFLRNPLLGSGYSTITLATDNSLLRALGETGALGLFSFLFIFIILWIALKEISPHINDKFTKGFVFGLAGGVLGLIINALLIDVFEASKVAENLWMMLGIGLGTIMLYKTKPIPVSSNLKKIFTSNMALSLYLFCLLIIGFKDSIANFFVADDFTWLRWAASSVISNIPGYFTDAQNFFYRPIDKTLVFFLYTLFSFSPDGYHIFILLLHLLMTLGVYILTMQIVKKKLLAFIAALIFMFLPAHSENVYWFSTISVTLSSLLIIFTTISYIHFRNKKSKLAYIIALILSILAFLTYEIAVVIPFILILIDIIFFKPDKNLKTLLPHIPFIVLLPLYYLIRNLTHAFSGGGDYSYNYIHIIPNILGNIFGYTGLFLFGQDFLSIYDPLRSHLKDNLPLFAIITILITIILLLIFKTYGKKLIKEHNNNTKVILFGIFFAVIALLPYLPLGNIAPRYIYLASAGLCISLVLSLQFIKKYSLIIFLSLILIIVSIYYRNLQRENYDWHKAGNITQNMLVDFRANHENLSSNSTIYVVKPPMKLNNAWVLPLGVSDSLWFIYRESSPSIYSVQSIEDAKIKIQNNQTKNNHIFIFDKQGNIQEIKII